MPATELSEIASVFSLRPIAPILADFTPPDGTFDPKGAWTQDYALCSLARGCRVTGQLQLSRQPLDGDRAHLRLAYRKSAVAKCWQQVDAEILCRADALATPLRWEARTGLHDAEGKPIADTAMRLNATCDAQTLRVTAAGSRREHRIAGPVALSWGLFDAVQRLPRTPGPSMTFSLIDHLDRYKPGQSLAWRREATISVGGREVFVEEPEALTAGTVYRSRRQRVDAQMLPLTAYEQTGPGVLPTVYWMDGAGSSRSSGRVRIASKAACRMPATLFPGSMWSAPSATVPASRRRPRPAAGACCHCCRAAALSGVNLSPANTMLLGG